MGWGGVGWGGVGWGGVRCGAVGWGGVGWGAVGEQRSGGGLGCTPLKWPHRSYSSRVHPHFLTLEPLVNSTGGALYLYPSAEEVTLPQDLDMRVCGGGGRDSSAVLGWVRLGRAVVLAHCLQTAVYNTQGFTLS